MTEQQAPSRAASAQRRQPRGALAAMTKVEVALFLREPVNVFLVLALPVLLLIGFGLIPGFGEPNEFLGGQSGTEFIASLGIGIVLASLGLSILPATLGSYRERGMLKRLHATPVRPSSLLIAQLVVVGGVALASVVLIVGVGMAAFGLALPRDLPFFVLSVLLGGAALLSIGLLVAALAPSAKASTGIGMLLFFPNMFLAGVYFPREAFPGALQAVSDVTPLGAAIEAVRDSWGGDVPRPVHLVTMIGYALVAGVLAARTFRWE
jgi:ABC-2 type transport system permease protein